MKAISSSIAGILEHDPVSTSSYWRSSLYNSAESFMPKTQVGFISRNLSDKTVTVAIPCFNEARYLGQCLQCLVSSEYDKSLLNIVVLLMPSCDESEEIAQQFCALYPNITILPQQRNNKSLALNQAIKISNSDIFIRVDAHAWYPPDYIPRLVFGITKYNCENIGGVRLTAPGTGVVQRAISILISHPFAAGDAHYRVGTDEAREVDSVYCGCFKRDVFSRVGNFDERLLRVQDRELNLRIRAAGGRIVLDPSIKCLYFPRTSVLDYLLWVFNGSFWLFNVNKVVKVQLLSLRNYVPMLFVLYLFALPIVSGLRVSSVLLCFISLPLFLYLVLLGVSSFGNRGRRDWPLVALMLVLLFPLTHISYGIGALYGICKPSSQRS